jgi:hypothetical protein
VVVEKPAREMKVNGAKLPAAPTDHDPLEKGLSKSVILQFQPFPHHMVWRLVEDANYHFMLIK